MIMAQNDEPCSVVSRPSDLVLLALSLLVPSRPPRVLESNDSRPAKRF